MKEETTSFKIKNVWLRGFVWAVFMFLITVILVPLIQGEELDMHRWHIHGAIWLVAGIVMAHTTEYFEKKKKKRG
jgi:hypothetical protein